MKELLKEAEITANKLKKVSDQLVKQIGSCRVYVDFNSPESFPTIRIHEGGRGLVRITFDETRGLFSWLKELGVIEEKP